VGFGRDRFDQHQGLPLGSRRKRGAFAQGIGTSRELERIPGRLLQTSPDSVIE
jgi:hypothetical protein